MRREVNWHVEDVWPLVIIIVVLGVVVCPSGFPFRASIWRAACVRHGHSIRATRPLYCRKKQRLFSSQLSLFLDSFRLLTTLMFPLKRGLIHEAVSHWRFRECHGGIVNWKILTSLPMCGFTAQLVEHRTGSWRSRVRIPLKPWYFSGFFLPIA